MTTFSIDIPALSQPLVDRSEDLRTPDRLARSWPSAKVLAIAPGGRLPTVATQAGAQLEFTDAARLGAEPPPGAVLIGAVDGVDYWAIGRPGGGTVDLSAGSAGTIRTVGPLLSDAEAVLAATAVALMSWHEAARFCARCGEPMTADYSGHTRSCPSGHQEFPRTDPAVIVLVHDGADGAVLARQPSWAPGRFSVLAGFAEAGESLEATVAREIGEEVGLRVRDVEYLGSQPWPFPRSLMIAFAARATRGATLRPRPGEIDDARWFSRRELRTLLAAEPRPAVDAATAGDPATAGITLPGEISIARRMLEGFVNAG